MISTEDYLESQRLLTQALNEPRQYPWLYLTGDDD